MIIFVMSQSKSWVNIVERWGWMPLFEKNCNTVDVVQESIKLIGLVREASIICKDVMGLLPTLGFQNNTNWCLPSLSICWNTNENAGRYRTWKVWWIARRCLHRYILGQTWYPARVGSWRIGGRDRRSRIRRFAMPYMKENRKYKQGKLTDDSLKLWLWNICSQTYDMSLCVTAKQETRFLTDYHDQKATDNTSVQTCGGKTRWHDSRHSHRISLD